MLNLLVLSNRENRCIYELASLCLPFSYRKRKTIIKDDFRWNDSIKLDVLLNILMENLKVNAQVK